MGKKLFITIIFLTTIMNIFAFLHINKNEIDKLLFDKTKISFRFDPDDNHVSKSEFLKKIKNFSQENDIEIAQYSFLNSNRIDIFSTMKDNYSEALFIPNVIFNRDIKVHNFEKILDVGFKNLLYIDTKDEDIIKDLTNELKNDCELYYSESTFKEEKFLFDRLLNCINVNFLLIFTFFIFAFILVLFFYYSNSKKEYFIHQLWGYTNIQTYHILNKPLYKSLFLSIVLSNLVLSGIIYKFVFSKLLLEALFIMAILNIVILLIVFLISIILFSISLAIVNNNNRKKGISKIIIISFISKFILLLSIIFMFENIFRYKLELNQNLESLELWKDTQNFFNIHETYSKFYHDHLASEDILNDKILRVYQDLSNLDKAFIIKTINFERPSQVNIAEENYNYNIYVKSEEDLYTPHGRNIVVDKNYIKRHIIKALDGKNIIDEIDNNDNVLNILVPEKIKSYENIIENSYKEWFYFQRVYVTNMYREACNQKKIETKIDDLKLNIIYIENNQHYFTYNQYSGDSSNTIEDPIITVYTENVDNSFLASCLGSYMIMESKDETTALKEISTITQKYNAIELNSISSVYDKKGEEIKNIEDRIDILILNTTITSLLLIMFMIIITYAYYKSSFLTIIIKSLHGHHFTYIYKHLILTNLFINILILPFVAIIYQKISLYMIIVIGLISIIDYLVARIINTYLLVKGELQFAKGELK